MPRATPPVTAPAAVALAMAATPPAAAMSAFGQRFVGIEQLRHHVARLRLRRFVFEVHAGDRALVNIGKQLRTELGLAIGYVLQIA